MTRFQETISLGLILGVIHSLAQPAKSVPVVPNFTQGSMTSHTETTSKQTETINSIDYATGWQIFSIRNKCFQQWAESSASNSAKLSECNSPWWNRGAGNKFSNWVGFQKLQLHNNRTRKSIPVHSELHGSRGYKPNCYSKSNRGHKRNRYYKYLYAIAALTIASPVNAADVGGVSATANPIANSSGSVTNQASRYCKVHI